MQQCTKLTKRLWSGIPYHSHENSLPLVGLTVSGKSLTYGSTVIHHMEVVDMRVRVRPLLWSPCPGRPSSSEAVPGCRPAGDPVDQWRVAIHQLTWRRWWSSISICPPVSNAVYPITIMGCYAILSSNPSSHWAQNTPGVGWMVLVNGCKGWNHTRETLNGQMCSS